MSFVLVGQLGPDIKAFGPFESAEDAREACNELGMPDLAWDVVRLYPWSASA